MTKDFFESLLVCNKAQKDKQVDFMAVKKFRKCPGLRFKTVHVQQSGLPLIRKLKIP